MSVVRRGLTVFPTKKLCPRDAIERTVIGDVDPYDPLNNFYEYTIDEEKCNGCGQCVMECKDPAGLGSIRLEVRYDLCLRCNQCTIADALPRRRLSPRRPPATTVRPPWRADTRELAIRNQVATTAGIASHWSAADALCRAVRLAGVGDLDPLPVCSPGRHPPVGRTSYSRPVTAAPQPEDIGESYQLPASQHVAPRSAWWYLADVILLAAALVAAALVAHRWRRRWMAVVDYGRRRWPTLVSFGKDVSVPIGAIGNVTASLVDPTLAVPFVVLLFFLLPLVAALLVGRVFCGGVCPLGAIQDLVVLWPVQLPRRGRSLGGMVQIRLSRGRRVVRCPAGWFARLRHLSV